MIDNGVRMIQCMNYSCIVAVHNSMTIVTILCSMSAVLCSMSTFIPMFSDYVACQLLFLLY